MHNTKSLLKTIKRKFVATPFDSLITIIIITLIIFISDETLNWLFNVADWKVVTENFSLYMFGSFPLDQQWRPILWITLLFCLTLITLFGPKVGLIRKIIPIIWIIMAPMGIILLAGGIGLKPIQSNNWGGLTLTLLLTISSIIIALPIGIILALFRQSRLFMLRWTSRIYIDVMRSVPLISVLFFGQLLIPLFLPMEMQVNRVLRAVLAFGLFASAYIAEDIRGGLQSIPKTQKEASMVLGLSKIQTIQLVLLPQAIRTAIPALTNQAIGILQNTSLMAILGLVELLGISRSILANPNFIGKYMEAYVWLAAIYWLICTAMALLSRDLERQFILHTNSKP